MAFTRFHDDPCRIVKQNQQMTDQGRWMLNVPGNHGDSPCYMLDPQIIAQKWGGNLWSNAIDVQSSLLGMDRTLTRDCLGVPQRNSNLNHVKSAPVQYPQCDSLTTDQSRVTNPAWMYKDLEQVDWYYLPRDPQENVLLPFQNNINTRVLEKDYFVREYDCVLMEKGGNYPSELKPGSYVGGPNTCASSNSCLKML